MLFRSDEGSAIFVKLQAVGPTIVLRDQLPIALGGDAKDAPKRDVDKPQIAFAIKRGTFQETFHFGPLAIGIRPSRTLLFPEFRRHRHEHFGFDQLGLLKGIEHKRLQMNEGTDELIQTG